jgi:hypothetical protein
LEEVEGWIKRRHGGTVSRDWGLRENGDDASDALS